MSALLNPENERILIGFTGTRAGMSKCQIEQFKFMLEMLVWDRRTAEFHVGGAAGADSEALHIVMDWVLPENIIVHPCPGVTASFDRARELTRREVFPPLVRDKHIAQEVDVLIAAPRSNKEELRSGTWATVRYARKALKPIIMLSR